MIDPMQDKNLNVSVVGVGVVCISHCVMSEKWGFPGWKVTPIPGLGCSVHMYRCTHVYTCTHRSIPVYLDLGCTVNS